MIPLIIHSNAVIKIWFSQSVASISTDTADRTVTSAYDAALTDSPTSTALLLLASGLLAGSPPAPAPPAPPAPWSGAPPALASTATYGQ